MRAVVRFDCYIVVHMMNGLGFGRDTMGGLGQDLALGAPHSTHSTKVVGRCMSIAA